MRALIFCLLSTFAFLLISCESSKENVNESFSSLACENVTSVFTINLDGFGCDVDIESSLGIESFWASSIENGIRTITVNSVASHMVGEFPNRANPNTIAEVIRTYTVTTSPQAAASITSGQGYEFGVICSGVTLDPYTAEFFIGTDGTTNRNWNECALQSTRSLGLDCNNAHVQPTGKYHYHGTPTLFVEDKADGSQMIKVGYAADGFPIYYKYGYDSEGNIIELTSGYQLKAGERGGDGVTAPDGCHDGFYFQDYEYNSDLSSLDECNGIFGRTPDAEEGEYYYVITDNFPSSPLCFTGTPDASFRLGGGPPQ